MIYRTLLPRDCSVERTSEVSATGEKTASAPEVRRTVKGRMLVRGLKAGMWRRAYGSPSPDFDEAEAAKGEREGGDVGGDSSDHHHL